MRAKRQSQSTRSFHYEEVEENVTDSSSSDSEIEHIPEGVSCYYPQQNIASPNVNFDVNNHPIENGMSVPSKLTAWALQHNIAHTAINDLLNIMKQYIPELPTDARTLLGTCRNIALKSVDSGKYYHFGLKTCIENLVIQSSYLKDTKSLEIILNIDGLPLSKSSSSQVYPILCRLSKNKTVDMIGIYHGYEKPKDANCFLEEFVNEANEVISNGIYISGQFCTVKIKSFICDAPAKSFVKYTKGHTGYFSCTKCHVEGDFNDGRVYFPEIKNLHLRTDEGFRTKVQTEHHTGTSIIENIPNFNMVDGFPLDYMHLICLGVVKKFMVLWKTIYQNFF